MIYTQVAAMFDRQWLKFHFEKPTQIIIEVFLGQGKIIEALRLANSLSGAEALSARKYLEAARKTNDPIVFYTVYTWFQQRNIRHRGSPDFLKSIHFFRRKLQNTIKLFFDFAFSDELCEDYVNHYQSLYCT